LNIRFRLAAAALIAAVLTVCPLQPARAQLPNNQIVHFEGIAEIEIYGSGIYTYPFTGTWEISWSDPEEMPDGHIESQMEILQIDVDTGELIMRHRTGIPSPGSVRSVSPGESFPAESFFDVFVEIELPGVLPGEVFHNETGLVLGDLDCDADHAPFVLGSAPGAPPSPNSVLLNDLMEPAGNIHITGAQISWYYPPETRIIVPVMRGTNILEPYRYGEDLYQVQAAVSGPHEVSEVEFSYRPAGSPDPWTVFGIDTDGDSDYMSTTEDKIGGDGWAAYLDRSVFPAEGAEYEFQATAITGDGPVTGFSDPYMIYSTPPFPEIINIPPDTTALVGLDSLIVLLVRLLDDFSVASPARIQVFPFGVDFKRPLTPVDQLALGADTTLNKKSCGPAAAASCLKYFADNGHPELGLHGGVQPLDGSDNSMTGEEMARELRGSMGTTGDKGTTPEGLMAGIRSYLGLHTPEMGMGWTIEKKDIEDYMDVGSMFTELEANGEDVMMVLENVLPNGDTVQHCVTLGSKGSTTYEVNTPEYSAYCISYRLDFMDPWGGEGTDQHEYNVGADANNRPTLEGYKVDDRASGNARIAKFIKVSPPEGAGSGSGVAIPAEADPGWIEIYSGMITGGGAVDTFYWDTAGFPGGLYMLEVVTETPEGKECRTHRLFGLPEYTVDADPPTPETPTKLMGSYPNPFNPSTTIEFYLARDAEVDLTIYDAAGRAVRHLVRGRRMHGGTHQITWNGIRDGGGAVASGVYFYRFRADGVEMSSKLVLLR
jgi:hypothetical protein